MLQSSTPRLSELRFAVFGLLLVGAASLAAQEPPKFASHPPLRRDPPPAKRAMATGPGYYVDAVKGDDAADGSLEKPWRTVAQAMKRLNPGDTLYLRGGVYWENVAISLVGREDAPITIRSYPGEQAILSGGLREFFAAPAEAWEPYTGPGAAEHEYRSKRTYPNMRDMVGAFGDSFVGLETYWHLTDLRSSNELADPAEDGGDLKPLWCGPGLHYNPRSGRIHVRLAHTQLAHVENYRGETDPRKLPLIIAPFRSIALLVDGGQHIKLQDLIVRGGGYETVVVESGHDVDFDNVTIRGGTYCMRTANTTKLRFWRSAMYGNAPPWMFRGDGSLRNRPGRGLRDIARLTCHALWTTDTGREFSVYAFPTSDDWEIGYSEFTDSHDGLYLGGIGLKFHHNLVDNFQDDGIYLSPMYPYAPPAELHIYQNEFRRCLTALAFGGTEDDPDKVFIYRNLFDLRGGVNYGRPSTANPEQKPYPGRVISDHGSPPWAAMNIYHNTFVMSQGGVSGEMNTLAGAREGYPRRVFNNIFLHTTALPAPRPPAPELDMQWDANLHWSPGVGEKEAADYFTRYRASPAYEQSKKVYPAGFSTNSLVADPRLVKAPSDDAAAAVDYRLAEGSPAIDAGVPLPAEWPDPLRESDTGKPDIGAMPLGAEPLQAGRAAPQSAVLPAGTP
jgi:hypothetical protein